MICGEKVLDKNHAFIFSKTLSETFLAVRSIQLNVTTMYSTVQHSTVHTDTNDVFLLETLKIV
jgi:hypothetical protein